jgi:choline dehydrogenase-like flavoprotein
MLPSFALSLSNVAKGLDFKKLALKFRHASCWISLARDRDSGRVFPDPVTGGIRIEYTPSAFDRQHILTGCIALAKIAYVEGATEIFAGIPGVAPFIRNPEDSSTPSSPADDIDPGVTDPCFQAWLTDLQRAGNKPPGAIFASAHQMGTNRMSVHERDGVVDSKGRVWGTDGLYISDTSVFPSASGVNPMVTNMAISDWISMNISKELMSANGMSARL